MIKEIQKKKGTKLSKQEVPTFLTTKTSQRQQQSTNQHKENNNQPYDSNITDNIEQQQYNPP